MYEKLRNAIDEIKIIDNHGHPGFAEYFEKLPEELRGPLSVDVFRTPEEVSLFPYLTELHYEAYEKLYGFKRADISDQEKRSELSKAYEEKRKDMHREIDKIMDMAGVEILIANIVLPESFKKNPRIKFIPSIDPLVFPFNNDHLKNRELGKTFVASNEYTLEQWKERHGYQEKGLENYLLFIDTILDEFVREGVVGFKFAIAYIRTTFFEKVEEKAGSELYKKAQEGNEEAYHRLQDYLVWYMMRKIVALDMPVQFHLAITDNYVRHFDPINLATFLEEESLKNAKIVVLHGGYPRHDQAEVLAMGGMFPPNNVHIDISGRIMLLNHPKIIAGMLRKWLEKPVLWSKILYGSDVIWGERFVYTCARTGRDAVFFALAGMIEDDIINEDIAIQVARNILRDNAMNLYKL
jgi:predicted TIM-barrel fold metal-dependent hydrolase